MKRVAFIVLAISLVFAIGSGKALAKKQFTLNIIGFAQCKKTELDTNPDCFTGNAGDIETHGHTIFVPYITKWIADPCDTTDGTYYSDPSNVAVAELKHGVRILVSDGGGAYDRIQVVDRDATDGLAKLILPQGSYSIYARALGKPGGCMDIDTLICYDLIDDVEVQVDCRDIYGNPNDTYVLVGHLDVDRSKNKPRWINATGDLLPAETGVGSQDPDYFDFFWQIYNNKLRLLQLRIISVD